jgi:lipoate-protein ligase A
MSNRMPELTNLRTPSEWRVERREGSAVELHGVRPLDVPGRAVWVLDIARPALVLGSTQPEKVADVAVAGALGVDVVRRRSGGGAVLLVPGEVAWLDVIVPLGDPLWHDDVGRSSQWLGDVWRTTLQDLGITGTEVHTGPLACGPLGRLVCFCAVGPGEVTLGEKKVVGISQRRTRVGARFQCAVYTHWDPGLLVPLLGLEAPAARAVDVAALGIGIPADEIVSAFLRQLPS